MAEPMQPGQSRTDVHDTTGAHDAAGPAGPHATQAILVVTGSVITTVSTLLASALGLVAALAWNKAISDWLPTVNFLSFTDPLAKDFAYAGVATLVAVAVISVLGVLNARIRGKNLLNQLPKS